MDAWLIRFARRDGRRYYVAAVAATALLGTMATFGITAIPSRYLRLSLGEYFRLIAVEAVLLGLFAGLAFYVQRARLRVIWRWLDGRPADLRDEVREAIFTIPWRGIITMFLPAVPAGTAVVSYLLLHYGGYETGNDVFALVLGAFVSVVVIGATGAHVINALCRPVRVLLDSSVPGPALRLGLGRQLVLSMASATIYGGASVGYLVTNRADAGSAYLIQVYAIALGSGLLVALLFGPMQVSILGPIRDLRRGTRAVADGRLDTHVPLTTGDELGGLTVSFNEMVGDLRASRTRIVSAGDEARRKVERDLHDGAQQRLVLLGLKLSSAERAFAKDPERARELITDARADLDLALVQLRDLARGIYPASLTQDGLTGALGEAVLRAGLPASLTFEDVGRYRPDVETAVYFCCIEALQNAAKHAGPDARAAVQLRNGGGELIFSVTDDGVGFDTRVAGSGLRNMDDRLGALGGAVNVYSAKGEGTQVTGRVPI